MAVPVMPDFAAGLAAAVGQLSSALKLPTGWVASPSLRWTPSGATLHVAWGPPRVRASEAATTAKRRKKKRSTALQQRSAQRAAAHKERIAQQQQQQHNHQQQLKPTAPTFIPNSVAPPPHYTYTFIS